MGVCPGVALAQTAPAADPTVSAGDNEIGEVVVTARKKVETVVSTPVSITALTSAAVESRGITNYTQLSDFTPAFKSDKQNNNRNDRYNQVFVARGMNPESDLASRAGVSIFMDGVPIGRGAIAGITDIERVEVVAGPQSAYYGRSTFSGAVNFITRPPSFTPGLDVDATYSSFNTEDVRASVEGGIVPDVLAARVSLRYYNTDGDYGNYAFNNKLGSQDTKSMTGSFLLTPGSSTRIRGQFTAWQDDDGSPAVGQLYAVDYNCKTPTAGVANNYICGPISSVPSNRMTQQNEIPPTAFQTLVNSADVYHTDLSHFGLLRDAYETHASVSQDLPAGYTLDFNAGTAVDALTFVVDTGDRDMRSTPNPSYTAGSSLIPYTQRTAIGQSQVIDTSGELRISSPQKQALTWMVGVNGYRQRETRNTYIFSNTGFAKTVPYLIDGNDTLAVFGSLNYNFTRQLSLSFEAREQSDKRLQVSPTARLALGATFQSFTPRVILSYHPTSNINLYASYAEGTRPGEFNANLLSLPASVQKQVQSQFAVPVAVPEEKVEMEEIGLKGNFFDHKLQILSAAYYGDWTGRHVTETVTYLNPAPQPVNVVVGGSEVMLAGVEMDVTYRVTPELTFEGTYDYSSAKIRSTTDLVSLQLLGVADPKGKVMPHTPVDSGSVSADYERDIGGGMSAFGRIDYVYTGRQYDSEANLAWTPDANRVNLRVGVQRGPLRLELFALNVFNDKTPTNIQRNTDAYTGQNTITVAPPMPASLGVHLSARY